MEKHPRFHSKAIFIAVSALLIAWFTAGFIAAAESGKSTISAASGTVTPASSVNTENQGSFATAEPERIMLRVLLAKIKGDLRVSSPGGIGVYGIEDTKIYEAASSGPLTFKRDPDGMILADVTVPVPPSLFEVTPRMNYPDPTGSPAAPAGTANSDNNLTPTLSNSTRLPHIVVISPLKEGELLTINGKPYRGALKVMLKDDFLWLINVVELEEYLYGVVPKEFKTRYPECNKAQAVVARTYALGHLGRFEKLGYDFDCTPQYQVYGGSSGEDPACTEGVNATKGMVIAYKGKLAKYPLYHSTCGGETTSNDSAYQAVPIEYLRGTDCVDDLEVRGQKSEVRNETPETPASPAPVFSSSPSSAPSPEVTPSVSPTPEGPPVDEEFLHETEMKLCNRSSYYRWTVTWTYSDMLENVKNYWNKQNIDEVKDLRVIRRDNSHRVAEIAIETNVGILTEKADRIRQIFVVKNPNGSRSNLYSTRFKLTKTGNGTDATWTAHGSGWGHGVGMCQFGTLVLAQRGYTYQDILKKYFCGVEIVPYSQLITTQMQGSGKKE